LEIEMTNLKNVLFIHPLIGNAYEIFKAIKRNKNLNTYSLLDERSIKLNTINKIMQKFRLPNDIYEINKKLTSYDLSNINIIFIIKCNEIYPKTLRKIKEKYKNIKIVNFSLDDMYAKHNRSIYYTKSIKYYDLIVTTKSYNVNELPKIGAKKVFFTYQGYSKDIHVPIINKTINHDVLFIGYPEEERINSILYLANNGIKINIYGYPKVWEKFNLEHENIINHKKTLEGIKYSEVISNSKITLCFLRKINRDLHTSRSIEIPACKGFMIAEKTNEHTELFEENKEAVFFQNEEELLEKTIYFLENETERENIRNNGYIKCLKKDYSYDNIIGRIFNELSY